MSRNRRVREQAQKSARPNNVTGKGAVNGRSKATQDFLDNTGRLGGKRSSLATDYRRKPKHAGRGWE